MDWTDAFRAAVRSMEISIINPPLQGRTRSIRSVSGARLMLPYVLHPIKWMPDYLIWVNRDYKPIGTMLSFAAYEEYKHLQVRRDDQRIQNMVSDLEPFVGGGYALFNDATAPWRSVKHAQKYYETLKKVELPRVDNFMYFS